MSFKQKGFSIVTFLIAITVFSIVLFLLILLYNDSSIKKKLSNELIRIQETKHYVSDKFISDVGIIDIDSDRDDGDTIIFGNHVSLRGLIRTSSPENLSDVRNAAGTITRSISNVENAVIYLVPYQKDSLRGNAGTAIDPMLITSMPLNRVCIITGVKQSQAPSGCIVFSELESIHMPTIKHESTDIKIITDDENIKDAQNDDIPNGLDILAVAEAEQNVVKKENALDLDNKLSIGYVINYTSTKDYVRMLSNKHITGIYAVGETIDNKFEHSV